MQFAREPMTRHHTLVYSWILIRDFSEEHFCCEFTECVSILKNELLLLITF